MESIDRAIMDQLSTTVLQQQIKQLKKENEDLKNQLNIQERKLNKTSSAFVTAIPVSQIN